MRATVKNLVDLENRFWKSMVEQDTDTALDMLDEPALMVSSHGAMKFDHARYREMAEHGAMTLKSFELSNMEVLFASDDVAVLTYKVKQKMAPRGKSETTTEEMADSSSWVRKNGEWRCIMHTETPVAS